MVTAKQWRLRKKRRKRRRKENMLNDESQTCLLQSCHGIATVLAAVFLIITLPLSGWFAVKKVRKHERVVVFRLGRIMNVKKPGLAVVLPFIDDWRQIDLRTTSLNIPFFEVPTKDKAMVLAEAEIRYQICNPIQSVIAETNVIASLEKKARHWLIRFFREKLINELDVEKQGTEEKMLAYLQKKTRHWGVQVYRVLLTYRALQELTKHNPPGPEIVPPGPNFVPPGPNVLPPDPKIVPAELKVEKSVLKVVPSGLKIVPSGPKAVPSELKIVQPGPTVVPSEHKIMPPGPKIVPPGPKVVSSALADLDRPVCSVQQVKEPSSSNILAVASHDREKNEKPSGSSKVKYESELELSPVTSPHVTAPPVIPPLYYANFGAEEIVMAVESVLSEELVKQVGACYQFRLELSGKEIKEYYLDLTQGKGKVGQGTPDCKPDVILEMSEVNFKRLIRGDLKPVKAYMTRKLHLHGDLSTTVKLEEVFRRMVQQI